MRPLLACMSVLCFAGLTVAQNVPAEGEELNFRLFEVKGRTWVLKSVEVLNGTENVRMSIEYKIKNAKKNKLATVEKTVINYDTGGKKETNEYEVYFNALSKSWISPKEGATFVRTEAKTVKAGKFACRVYTKGQVTYWYAAAMPGLLVYEQEEGKIPRELYSFDTERGDPALDEFPEIEGSSKIGGESGKVTGGKLMTWKEVVPPGEADFRLYQLSGRKWKFASMTANDDGTYSVNSQLTYEITKVSKSGAEYTWQVLGDPKSVFRAPQNGAIQFDLVGAREVQFRSRGESEYVQFPNRHVRVAAGVFECNVFVAFTWKGDKVEVSGVSYLSAKYPGLTVLWHGRKTARELLQFDRDRGDRDDAKEGDPLPAIDDYEFEPGPPPPPRTAQALYSLYMKPGRNWLVCHNETKGKRTEVKFERIQIIEGDKDHTLFTTQWLDRERQPIKGEEPVEHKYNFKERSSEELVGSRGMSGRIGEETLEYNDMVWECWVYEDIDKTDRTIKLSWLAKKYLGLWVKTETQGPDFQKSTMLSQFSDE